MEKKFKLTEERIRKIGSEGFLYRIEALRDFGTVKKGDKGGFVEKESNLSHDGNAWVFDNAKVFDGARISDNAKIFGNAEVSDYANVFADAEVSGNAEVSNNARVFGDAKVSDHACVSGDAEVFGNAKIFGKAEVFGEAQISDDARVFETTDYIVFKNWWSSGRYFTWTRSNDRWKVGCFYGTGEELVRKAYLDSELSGREYERIVKYVEEIKQQAK